jgi:hypothetical protein
VVKAYSKSGLESAASAEVNAKPVIGVAIKENDPTVIYTGSWTSNINTGNTDSRAVYSGVIGTSSTFSFTGTGVQLISKTSSGRGIAKITVDGIVYMVDTYTPSTIFKNPIFTINGLSSGSHTIKIEVTGTKNPASTSNIVYIDGFIVELPVKHILKENDSIITYTTGWSTNNEATNTDSRAVYSNTTGKSATFSFTGKGIKLISKTSNARGIAKVTIDGVVYMIDLYTPTTVFKNELLITNGLSDGSHTIVVEVAGTKNEASTSNVVYIDGFVILSN